MLKKHVNFHFPHLKEHMAKLYGTAGKIICKYVTEKERHGVPMVLKIQWEWGKIIRK